MIDLGTEAWLMLAIEAGLPRKAITAQLGLSKGSISGILLRRRNGELNSYDPRRVKRKCGRRVAYDFPIDRAILELMADGRERRRQEIAPGTGYKLDATYKALRRLERLGLLQRERVRDCIDLWRWREIEDVAA